MKTLVIGGVAGGAGAAARLRRNDETMEIILIERGEFISFANCGLPYYVGEVIKGEENLFLQTPESFHARFQVDVRVKHELLSLDASAQIATIKNLSSGEIYEESYDDIVLSPGASPIRPPFPGADSEFVFTLRNVPDTFAIKEYISTHDVKTAAVIGGGFIGIEMAENLHNLGLEVSIIEASSHVIASLDPDMAAELHNHIRSCGAHLYLNGMAAAITKEGVSLSDGTLVPAGIVIMSIGVRPETGFLKESGLALGARGEILVDSQLKTNLPHVYAVGDAISVTHLVNGKPAIIPLAGPANKQARIVADVICGQNASYTATQGSAIAKVFEMTAAVTGESEASLARNNIPYKKAIVCSNSNASYYPGGTTLTTKILFHPETGKLLGAQITGRKGVDKRMDVLATALRANMTVFDLAELELCYAPPFSSAKDPVNMVGYVASNMITGYARSIYIEDLKDNESLSLLDIRTTEEYEKGTIGNAISLPLDEIRSKNLLEGLDPSKEYVVICHVGLRGHVAQRMFAQHGFKVSNLIGGYRLYANMHKDGQI